jgi:hypothetical protein
LPNSACWENANYQTKLHGQGIWPPPVMKIGGWHRGARRR